MISYRILLFPFFSLILYCHLADGIPISKGVDNIQIVTTYLPSYATVLLSLGALLFLVYFVLGCVCCPNKSIKALSYQNGFPVSRLNENNFENAEITIFPPHSTIIDLQPVSPTFPGFDDKVTFEPLPDILPKTFTGQSAACSSRPAHFSALLRHKVSLHDWFDDPNNNFPREQLQYLQEIGCGWFGRIVEGEASQICDNEEKTAVIVKILREEASPSEHLHFLHEVRPYRDLKHPNVVQLLGRCLETDPFLLIMEHTICDLKSYLIKPDNRDSLMKDSHVLHMVSNIASGLNYMHDKGFCHLDLAAHNCFIHTDNNVKIGDYGVSFDRWKGDYYCLGDIALPIRWYSPEILKCSETTIETKDITKEANVWAFGVVIWEIMEFGKLPYEELSDEEVLQRVLIEKSVQLSLPNLEIPYKDEISLVMSECWKPRKHRPQMEKINSFITQFCTDKLSIKNKELTFEERWNSIHPKITEISSYTGTESSSLKFENDFSTRSDLQNISDNEILSSFEMSFDMLPKTGFSAQLSPSLNVLNGSIDELTENDAYLNSISLSCGKYDADTLSNISDRENFQLEDDKDSFHPNNVISDQISAAIRDLDLVLANQPDSSRNSTLRKPAKPALGEVEMADNEVYLNGISAELSKSSDLSNISEKSFSKYSNPTEHTDPAVNERYEDLSANSDLNGNCNFYNSNVEKMISVQIECKAVESDSLCKFEQTHNVARGDYIDIDSSDKITNNVLDIKKNNDCVVIENTLTCSNDKSKLSSVPDIVIHESPSINVSEILDEYCESGNNQNVSQNDNSQKIFRFVFKEASDQDSESKHQDLNKELVHDLTESLKKSDRSKPLTSTPVKSNSDSFSPCLHFDNSGDVNKNNLSNDVFYETTGITTEELNSNKKILDRSSQSDLQTSSPEEALFYEKDPNHETNLYFNSQSYVQNSDLNHVTINSTGLDHFTTAQSSLDMSKTKSFDAKVSENNSLNEKTYMSQIETDITVNFNGEIPEKSNKISANTLETKNSNNSSTMYISAENDVLAKEDYSKSFPDVISPPNGYVSSSKPEVVINFSDADNDIENGYLEDSKASETVSPPQAFQDDGLAVFNDSYSESQTSFDQEFSTSAECGSSENLEQYLEDDHLSQANISSAKLLETSFPEVESKSFTYETRAEFSGNMRPRKNGSSLSFDSSKNDSKLYHSGFASNDYQTYNLYENVKPSIQTYDQMIVEDLDTGEQTVINESYSVCDDYENSGESDEILKINTETDEAIIVDSSEALIGFVPSRSIELLQEFEVMNPMNSSYAIEEEKESSDSMNIDACNSASPSPAAMKHTSSPYESPESTYPQPYRNFCLQNQVIEEEITDEIVSPSSFHSSSSYCSNEIFMDEEKMSQSSESPQRGEMYETSIMPSVDHLYISDDGSKSDISSAGCSPEKENVIVNSKYRRDEENNHISVDQDDVMHSYQPTQSVRWLSDETLDVDGDDHSPIIIEGREILAGDIMQTCELTAEDIASALSQLEAKGHLSGLTPNHLSVSQSPSPFSSVESSPCRDTVYTPDFESESDDGSGTSCSSTSGSFECIHNKFKNTVDISKVIDESDKSASSREHSPLKVFSKTWDCHATPTRGVLVTPEKKFNSLRKSVSFHEEDIQVVFEYPPASDSSEDGYPSDNEEFCKNIDYLKYADWDLQVGDEAEEIVEIEELDSEPYVRRPPYSSLSLGPLNRPMHYTITTGFSDEDLDLSDTFPPSSCNAPSNSPDEEKVTVSDSKMSELIQSHLNYLVDEENRLQVTGAASESQPDDFNSKKENSPAPMTSVQESNVNSVAVEDIIINKLLPECSASCKSETVHKEDHTSLDIDGSDVDEEVIAEEISIEDSEPEGYEFNEENEIILPEAESTYTHNTEFINEAPIKKLPEEKEPLVISSINLESDVLSDIKFSNVEEYPENKEVLLENLSWLSEVATKEFRSSDKDAHTSKIAENSAHNSKSIDLNDLIYNSAEYSEKKILPENLSELSEMDTTEFKSCHKDIHTTEITENTLDNSKLIEFDDLNNSIECSLKNNILTENLSGLSDVSSKEFKGSDEDLHTSKITKNSLDNSKLINLDDLNNSVECSMKKEILTENLSGFSEVELKSSDGDLHTLKIAKNSLDNSKLIDLDDQNDFTECSIKKKILAENLSGYSDVYTKEFKNSDEDVHASEITENSLDNSKLIELDGLKNRESVPSHETLVSQTPDSDMLLGESKLINDFSNQIDVLINLDEGLTQVTNSTDSNKNILFNSKNMHSKSETSLNNLSESKFSIIEDPVQALQSKSEYDKQCVVALKENVAFNVPSEVSSEEFNKDSFNVSKILISHAQSDSDLTKKSSNKVNDSSAISTSVKVSPIKAVGLSNAPICSTDFSVSKTESSNFLLNDSSLDLVRQTGADVVNKKDDFEEISNKSLNANISFENNHVLSDSSVSAGANVAQNATVEVSSNCVLSEVLETITSVPTDDKVCNVQDDACSYENMSIGSLPSTDLLFTVTPEFVCEKDAGSLCESASVVKRKDLESLLHVPKIIITPASESEADDELEEFLRGQLEHFHSEVSPQEDFSVTSEFSSRPFDDVFESYISADSSEYIEAYNFEFENGNFFEDFIDDYPRDLQTGMNDTLYPDDGRQKRSSSLPLMTENLSDDDSLTIKSDSSLVYDNSKGITRL